jgi:RNA polymerase sigma factor (sigma-70 family)
MQIDKKSMLEMAELVATSVVAALKSEGVIGSGGKPKSDKTAYQKTEQLLYNYKGFKRIVEEKKREIKEIRMYGVPQKCGAVGERVQSTPVQTGLMLPEESVERAVHNVEASVQGTVQAIALIDKCMGELKSDPYYDILEMRYFEGRTQEDIALKFGVSQVTISNNKNRLVRELSMRIFPNQSVNEILG